MHEKAIVYQEEEKPRDNCAVVGVFSKTQDVATTVLNGLIELNHRGQEGSGIAIANGHEIKLEKDSGLADIVFSLKHVLPDLPNSFVAIGHNRYSTSGSLSEMQPFVDDGIAVAHNGNLINVRQLKDKFDISDEIDGARSDTRIALAVINRMEGTEKERILQALPLFEGAYSFVFATKDALFASRDSRGFRPLSVGELPNGGYVVASETSAFSSMGARFLRDVRPGETVMVDKDGLRTIVLDSKNEKLSQCIFELIYISRPDSVVFGIPVMEFRLRQGRILARHLPDVDLIMPVPRSGIASALGVGSVVAKERGTPYIEGLYTNPYRGIIDGGRTFIRPNGRDKAATEKYSVNEVVVFGQRIAIIDDSIVRGSLRIVVEKLRKHGVKEVHALIASPAISHSCHFGVDFGKEELLANRIEDPQERAKYLGLDSLYYISYAELLEAALGNPVENIPEVFEQNDFCGACFTGRYPIKTDGTIKKVLPVG